MYGIKTAKDAEAMLASCQEALIAAATESTHRLADRVADVEEWRGILSVMAEWERGLEWMAEHVEADRIQLEKWKLITRMALRGADDSWSGRGNDAKRSFHDGRLKALSRLETSLAYADDETGA
jgi:hypothetical protein